jgi:RNA-directed DNA polymerase
MLFCNGTDSLPREDDPSHKLRGNSHRKVKGQRKGGSFVSTFKTFKWELLMRSETTMKRLKAIPSVVKSGKRVNGLFRLLSDRSLWHRAYSKIATNRGSMTPGVDGETFDGISLEKIDVLVSRVMEGTYEPTPVRRVYILKANGKKRPLGIPTASDRLVQEALRSILNEIYEPIFSIRSHGFRSGRSCHSALEDIKRWWNGTKWFVEVDIVGYFDNIDHRILMDLLAKRIDDKRFLRLVHAFLQAGYLEDWRYGSTYSGTPQGGIISPLLANIYLHELDGFMEKWIEARNSVSAIQITTVPYKKPGSCNHSFGN